MNKYIFFSSCDIHDMGGIPLYYAGKAAWLESQGWKVYIFHPGNSIPDCAVPGVNKYVDGSLVWPSPDWRFSKRIRQDYLKQLERRIGRSQKGDTVIIETHDWWTSPWAELLAKRLKAKHIIHSINEWNDQNIRHIRRYSDFYVFKFNRRELYATQKRVKMIFEDDSRVNPEDSVMFQLEEDPVMDIPDKDIEQITHHDWNIGYIGRSNKDYMHNIITGVCDFAKKYRDHAIQFIVLGDFLPCKEFYEQQSENAPNLSLVELGNRFPLPRSYFSKVDVIIAGAGSARCSAYEGIPTLIPDAQNYLCNGLLGYETKAPVYREENILQRSFEESLERVLVQKVYQDMPYDFPAKVSVADCCKQNFDVINHSEQTKEYYDCSVKDKFYLIKGTLRHVFPKLYSKMLSKRKIGGKNDPI